MVGLWGGAVANLGTRRHHDQYLQPTGTLELEMVAEALRRVEGLEARGIRRRHLGRRLAGAGAEGEREEGGEAEAHLGHERVALIRVRREGRGARCARGPAVAARAHRVAELRDGTLSIR